MSLCKVALVTGAGSGIGRALSILYAKQGVRSLALADIEKQSVLQTAEMIRELSPETKCLPIQVDVSNAESVQRMIDDTIKHFGALHYAANVAGMVSQSAVDLADAPLDQFDRVMKVNTYGVLNCMQAEIKAMKKQDYYESSDPTAHPSVRGSIVNVASVAGYRALPRKFASYVTSKHAVLGLTRAAALDHAKDGIRINAMCPGYTDTAIMTSRDSGLSEEELMVVKEKKAAPMRASAPMNRMGTAEESAEVCAFLTSEKASFVTGAVWECDGGMSTGAGIIYIIHNFVFSFANQYKELLRQKQMS